MIQPDKKRHISDRSARFLIRIGGCMASAHAIRGLRMPAKRDELCVTELSPVFVYKLK